VIDGQGEDVAIGFGSDTGHPPGVCQETDLAEVGPVRQARGDLAVRHNDVDDALLDEVHLGADSTFLDDDITCWIYV
jgi:hypothetical protein